VTIESGGQLGEGSDAEIGGGRPLPRSMLRGFLCRCPNCGRGKLFRKYLRAVPSCAECGEAYDGRHRADDLPPYLTVFVVGHLVVAWYMALEEITTLGMWTHMAIFVSLTLVLSLGLLQPMKGLTIGLQWAMRMHGFGEAENG
jgi:uncharacterized protein (DUF983 family)